ncbi:MAG: YchF-related putative GTPase [Candidatus Aenigmarchaeota archaeon]|nr:YchF-related putative GTPase [Candidatus Aenigmarchaeota archaeon]MDI6722249.1 YchF-related putative GTPase [Candidatus Aenigmarchaeota archaeon]
MVEIGLVGAPSSGKSTFFKACTMKDVKIAPYPFTTLEPNEGLAYVRTECACLNARTGTGGALQNCVKCASGTRLIPIKLVDVAGLVPDAHLGRGRGNEFLGDVMKCDALIHVLDVSGSVDYEGNPAENFDPEKTVKMLEGEIDCWLFSLIKKDWKLIEASKDPSGIIEKRLSGIGIKKTHLGDISDIKSWDEEDILEFISSARKKAKPVLIAGNKHDKRNAGENIRTLQKTREAVPVSAEIELALREAAKEGLIEYMPGDSSFRIVKDANEKQKLALEFMKKYLEKNGNTGVQECLRKIIFDILGMIVVFPVEDENRWTNKKGEMLPDAFLMKKGSTALDLAYRVHEDIGKRFISAISAKTKRNVSSDYPLQAGDVISIKAGR